MSKVNGKSKGNNFERTIANMFSERFADYTGIPQSFRRNPDSGSFWGGTNISRAETHDTDWAIYGDLICPRNFNFSVECKHYKTPPTLNAILKEDVSDWDKWLKQARQDANASGKEVMVIIRYNRTETLVMLDMNITDLNPVIHYKGTEIFQLKDVLEETDSFFFAEK